MEGPRGPGWEGERERRRDQVSPGFHARRRGIGEGDSERGLEGEGKNEGGQIKEDVEGRGKGLSGEEVRRERGWRQRVYMAVKKETDAHNEDKGRFNL